MSENVPVYNLKQLHKAVGLAVVTLRRYIKQGRLTASKIGRSYYVLEDDLIEFVKNERKG